MLVMTSYPYNFMFKYMYSKEISYYIHWHNLETQFTTEISYYIHWHTLETQFTSAKIDKQHNLSNKKWNQNKELKNLAKYDEAQDLTGK